MQIYVSMHLLHNDYIALIAFFFCDIKCFKKSQSWMGFELITMRYSGIVLMSKE